MSIVVVWVVIGISKLFVYSVLCQYNLIINNQV
jgi:hypothetical protein